MVVFTSDNGFNCGHHGIWGKGNGTLPFNMYESSVKVPFIVRYPKWIPQGTLSEAVVGGIDWFPTVLRMAGIPLSPEDIPGRDFLDVLQGKKDRIHETAFLYDEYGDTRMMIRGEWKYIKRYPDGPNLLFHLGDDPGEEQDRLDTVSPHLDAELDEQLETWFSAHTRPQADSRGAGVQGFGQDKRHGEMGFQADSFCQQM